MTVLRVVIVVIQMTALMAYFLDWLHWPLIGGMLAAFLVSLLLPLVATGLAAYAAVKVWGWSLLLALLVFLPGLVITLTALAGAGMAGLLGALLFRRVRARGGFARGPFATAAGQPEPSPAANDGEIIEGEVISSRVDNESRS